MSAPSPFAIVLALLAALAAGIVGAFAQMRRMSLAGDAMSHIALPGLGLALLFGVNPLIGGGAALVIGALLVWKIEKHSGLATEAVIGVVFSASLAIGALVTPNEDIIEALFGGFRAPSPLEFTVATAVSLAVLGALYLGRDRFVLNLFSRDLAAATGLHRGRLDLAYLVLFSLTLLLGLRFLGALLAGALIVIPAAVARQWTRRLSSFIAVSAAVSFVSVAVGIAISAARGLTEGPTVVTVASAMFAASVVVRYSKSGGFRVGRAAAR